MYIRRKVFSILDTEEGERLFSTTDYILDQKEFAGETKRRNKALKRQWFEKIGEADGNILKDNLKERLVRKGKSRFIDKIDLDAASKIRSGRLENRISQNSDELAWKEGKRRHSPDRFKEIRELDKRGYMNKKSRKTVPQSPKPTTPTPEAVVSSPKPVPQSPKPTTPNPEAVVSNPKPVIKTESKLSRLAKNKYTRPTAPNPEAEAAVSKKAPVSKEASFTPKKASVVPNPKPSINKPFIKSAKNKYARTAAGLLALGGTAAGGYYLLNKKKNKEDKEDKD